MKKIILSTLLGSLFCVPALAQSQGYLQDTNGSVVKNSTGLCWKTSSSKTFDEACGDQLPAPMVQPVAVKPEVPVAPVVPVVEAAAVPVRVVVNTTVLFAFDSDVLTGDAKAKLDAAVSRSKVVGVDIVGHTDPFGSEGYNEKLGMRRAQAVKDYLVARQVPSQVIQVQSAGEAKLEVQCKPSSVACHAPNRRAQIHFDLEK